MNQQERIKIDAIKNQCDGKKSKDSMQL